MAVTGSMVYRREGVSCAYGRVLEIAILGEAGEQASTRKVSKMGLRVQKMGD